MKNYKDSTIAYYNNNAPEYFDRTIKINMKDTYDKFLQYLPKHAHILDAGCGVGRDSEFFIHQGYQVTALDASIEMVKLTKSRIAAPVLHQDFSSMSFENEFDGIWTCASLLHLSIEDLQKVFFKFINALKTDGIWYISFKYGIHETIEQGRLFTRFTEHSFQEFAKHFPQLSILDLWYSESYTHTSNQWLQGILKKIP